MNLQELVSQFVIDTKGTAGSLTQFTPDSSIGAFLPELTLCATIVVMLLLRLSSASRKINSFWVVLAGTSLALFLASPWTHLAGAAIDPANPAASVRMEMFTGMLVFDPLTVFIRSVLLVFAILFTLFTRLSGLPDKDDAPDIYSLVLGATLGMCLMASANHLLMVFMAMEMASVPSYALAGMLKGRREGSEAALKYCVFGAGAAGVMLYGISLISGLLNTAHLPTLAAQLAERLPSMQSEEHMVLALGGLMIMVGLAFKLSAVPFHFWCPDVFEGACAEVNAFLSVASKAAALALLVRVSMGMSMVPPDTIAPGARSHRANTEVALADPRSSTGLFAVSDAPPSPSDTGPVGTNSLGNHSAGDASRNPGAVPQVLDRATIMSNLEPVRSFIGKLIALFAVVTCTFGNLAAYGQTNIKRLLAYSTIAHAGYMMMAVPAVMVLAGRSPEGAQDAVGALALYISVYVFMNLGAFVIVAFLRNAIRSERIADYSGLIRQCPFTVICFSLILFGLVGLPPLSGFLGKFAIFGALVDAYRAGGASATYILVMVFVGGLNTAVSLFYYLRVVKVMTMDAPADDRPPFSFPEVSLRGAFIGLVTLPTALLFLNWDGLRTACLAAARYLFST